MFWQRRADKAARFENWKWIESEKGSGLYDLGADLEEKHDLSQSRPEIARMMREKFAAWQAEMQAAEPRGPFRDY
jgi:hypothetical protein